MTTKSKVERIAAGLTKAQRAALMRHRPVYGDRSRGWPGSAIRDEGSFAQAGRPMMDLGLIAWPNDPRSSRTLLTPLGKQVRDHLLQQDPSND